MFKTNLAYQNWYTKYKYGDETPMETQIRAAKTLASVEKSNQKEWEEKFLKTLVKFDNDNMPIGLKCTLGGRITANIGTKYKATTLLNCYINGPVTNAKIVYERKIPGTKLTIDNTIQTQNTPDSLANIMLTVLEQAETLKSEGGYGINFDFIRPRGTIIGGIGIRHPGVVHYMGIWDAVSDVIVKGDNDGYKDILQNYLITKDSLEDKLLKKMARKGAMMAVLSVSHPDIEEFVRAKQTPGRLTKFNISVLVDDEFMNAVANDDLYDLRFGGIVYKRIKAKELYELIMKSTYNRAEPGIIFYDNMQKNNPISYLGDLNSTNPCLAKGTLVATESGLVPVESVKVGDKIQTTLGFGKVQAVEVHENHDIYRVLFSDGTHLDATLGHIFHVQRGGQDNRKKWDNTLRLGELRAGDIVRKAPYRFITNERTDLTRDHGLLAGLYLGDGCFSNQTSFNIACDARENNSYIVELFERLGLPWRLDLANDGSNSCRYYVTDSQKMGMIFSLLGIEPQTSKNKSFPLWWVNSNRGFIYGVMDGLISSDGNVNLRGRYPQVRFKNCSKNLHEMLRHLMLLVGADYKIYESCKAGEEHSILGRKVKRINDTFEGVIDNDSILNFYLAVGGLSHPEKNTKLMDAVKSSQLSGVKWATTVRSIEYMGKGDVYDLYEPMADDWNANGLVHRGCGEIGGNPATSTVCLLGSINLTQYVLNDRTFDWFSFEEDVAVFARMLDNVNDVTESPLPQYKWATKNIRQYGMGINGLGSTLYMLGVKYNSKEAVDFTDRVNWLKEEITWRTSAELAAEKGAFPAYSEQFLKTYWFNYFTRISEKTRELIKKHGVRNAKTTTNPPLGNSSVICDNISNGIEPVFMHEYNRTVIIDNWPDGLTKENVKDVLTKTTQGDAVVWQGVFNGVRYHYEPHNRGLCHIEVVRDFGYDWVLSNFPGDVIDGADYLVTTEHLSVNDHLNIQEVTQRNINQSVSKTANIPSDYPFEDFKSLYFDAWKRGLNGFTTYRDGSMEAVLSKIERKEQNKEIEVVKGGLTLPEEFINGQTKIIIREGMKFYIHFSYLPQDIEMQHPVALWIDTNSTGEAIAVNHAVKRLVELLQKFEIEQHLIDDQLNKIKGIQSHRKLGKMISMCLRHNLPIPSVVAAIDKLPEDHIVSLIAAVRKFLSATIKDGTKVIGKMCDACRSENVIYESGCYRCLECGSSACG